MNSYALTPLAWEDISEIWDHIAQDSQDAANRVEEAIYEACTFIADTPRAGHTRADLTSLNLRFWTLTAYTNYSIVYRPDTSPVRVIAILHGGRNLRRVLKQRQ